MNQDDMKYLASDKFRDLIDQARRCASLYRRGEYRDLRDELEDLASRAEDLGNEAEALADEMED